MDINRFHFLHANGRIKILIWTYWVCCKIYPLISLYCSKGQRNGYVLWHTYRIFISRIFIHTHGPCLHLVKKYVLVSSGQPNHCLHLLCIVFYVCLLCVSKVSSWPPEFRFLPLPLEGERSLYWDTLKMLNLLHNYLLHNFLVLHPYISVRLKCFIIIIFFIKKQLPRLALMNSISVTFSLGKHQDALVFTLENIWAQMHPSPLGKWFAWMHFERTLGSSTLVFSTEHLWLNCQNVFLIHMLTGS